MNKKISDFSKQIETDNKKIKDTKNDIRRISSKLSQYGNYLFSKGITKLEDIKKFLVDQNISHQDRDAGVISAILNCKQTEEKIYLNDNLFSKKIKFYLYGKLDMRCLTDDFLQLQMLVNVILKDDPALKLYSNCNLTRVKVVTDNYHMDGIRKGYVQDYDPTFSAICIQDISDELVQKKIEDKNGLGEFEFGGKSFIYWGDDIISFVVLKGLSDQEIFQRFKNMKYFTTEKNKITEGEKKLIKSDSIFFMDNYIEPESFCPSYWIPLNEIEMSFFFEFEIGYNLLYWLIEGSQANKDSLLSFPDDMCYWDTVTQCFDFIAVLAITSQKISEKNKRSLLAVYDKYYQLKAEINKWKTNQLLFQRIVQDFLNAFLNDSEYVRFVNLLNKVKKYIEVRNKLKNNSEVIQFFSGLSFAKTINEQLSEPVMGLADRIEEALSRYVNGNKPDGLLDFVRSIAADIFKCLPSSSNKNNKIAFPFIAAPGGLLGKLYDSENPISSKIQKNYTKRTEQKKKEARIVDENVKMITRNHERIDKFLTAYVKRAQQKYELTDNIHYRAMKNKILRDYADNIKTQEELIKESIDYERTGKLPTSKKLRIHALIENYIKALETLSTYKKPTTKKEQTNEDLMAIEIEDEGEGEVTTTKKINK